MTRENPAFPELGRTGTTAPGQAAPSEPAGDNIVDLVKHLTSQGTHLADQQLKLVKAEIRESTNELKAGIGGLAGAAAVGIAGLGVTLMGVAYLLGQAIDNVALATLLVGLATLGLAYVLYAAGSKKMGNAHLVPERTQRTLERTPDIARGDIPTEQTR